MTGDYVLHFDTDLCQKAKTMHEGAAIIFSQVGQIILAITALILLFIATMFYRKHKIALHPNLMLIVGNIIFLYAFHSIYIVIFHGRYQLLLYFSSNPCNYLTPVWLNTALRLPRSLYIGAFTLSHLALTMERARATFMATRYEKEGIWCPLFCLIILYTIAIIVSSTMVALASQDQEFWQPSLHVNLTTNSNANFLIYLHLFWLAVVIFTAIVDYILLVTNRKNRIRNNGYSLSRTYQIKENIVVMSLIWPLDVWYAIAFIVFFIGVSYIRLIRDKLGLAHFIAYYDILYMIIPMHSIVTLLLYLRFVKKYRSGTVVGIIAEPQDPTKTHFEQLKSQWSMKK